VRKQYNFWPSGHGFDAWDVDRLIDLSATLNPMEVPLTSIQGIDTDYWFSTGQKATVRNIVEHVQLMLEVDMSYPIILGADGRVMDGMHRVARALLEGRATISVVQFRDQPEPDYRDCHPEDLPY
jgi:hypothetical protein